jgi:signal transduction histidine kinase/ligand-binding sensor domain-containing protein/DNA-binding response OmpR family regulator
MPWKMSPQKYLLLPVLLLLTFSCSEKKEEAAHSERETARQSKTHFLVNRLGDTIPTGVPIPAKGKWIDPDSVARPKRVPLRGTPKVVPAHANVYPAGAPKVVPFPKEITVVTPGKNGVPLPKTTPAEGKVIPASQPPPIPALPLRIKDGAIGNFQYLDMDQGMSHDNVFSMFEDSRGYLWFGTFGGVSRYDGKSFLHYTQKEGLMDYANGVYSILEDRHGNLWFGTISGVSRYDGESFIYYRGNLVRFILEDSRGRLWFGTNIGVSLFDGDSFTQFTEQEGLIGDYILFILEDQRGHLWFHTTKGVCRFDGESFFHHGMEEGIRSYPVSGIAEDSQGRLWFGSENGVSCFDGENYIRYTEQEGFGGKYLRPMLEDSRGDLWLNPDPATSGVIRFDGANFFHYTEKEGLSSNNVSCILEDSQGNLWFGTRGGVTRFDGRSFAHYSQNESLSTRVWPILEDSQGNLWIGAREGVNCFDGKNFIHYTEENGLINSAPYSFLEDSRGNLWIGTQTGGVSRFDGTSFIHYTKNEGLSDNWVWSIREDSRGHFWFATNTGISRYDGESFTHYTDLTNLVVLSIEKDSLGHLWFGTNGGGVSRFDGTSFIHYTKNEGLSDNWVWSIWRDSRGNLWFGTQAGGVNRFDGTSFIHFTDKVGLSNNQARTALEDKLRRVWVSTKTGVDMLLPVSGLAPSATNLGVEDYQFFTFGKADGLKRIIFNAKSVCLDRKNRIWWGNDQGLTMLDLNTFRLPAEPPRVRLSHMEVNEEYIDFRRLDDTSYRNSIIFGESLSQSFNSVAIPFYNYPSHLKLPHDLNHLTFHFSAIDWAAPHKIQYSYLLEGLDKNWRSLSSENKADYRNLPHGVYTFRLKAIGAAQVWSEPFEYTFTIRPPWWRTWWANFLYGLTITSLLYALFRFLLNRNLRLAEIRRLKELDRFKTKLYTNITHEFRTPLTVINGMVEQIRENPRRRLDEGLEMIRRNSDNLLRLVNQMLSMHKLEAGVLPVRMAQGDVIHYLKYIVESFHSFAGSKDIAIHFLADEEEFRMDYDPEKLLSIASNLLSNAVKFTPAGGEVFFSVSTTREDAERLIIRMQDTGTGIAPEDLPFIFDRFYQADDGATRQGEGTGIGLALTRELVKLLNGEIEVESRPGQGTEFTVSLPVSRKAVEAAPDDEQSIQRQAKSYMPPSAEFLSGAESGAPAAGKPLALLIEDNADVISYLETCLEGAYSIAKARDGDKGVEKALSLAPDIIISDVMMPGKDGFEVCRILKQDERSSHIPIILLTARADQDSKVEGLERGADAYLAKPFDKAELLVRMRKLLELRKRLQTHYAALAQQGGQGDAWARKEPENAFVLRIRRLVENHLSDPGFTIGQLCREALMSHSQLHRKLTALTGYSAARFMRLVRLTKAKELLPDRELTIAEIAFDCGFPDPVYFGKVFKAEFGQTPSGFREAIARSGGEG